MKVVAALIMLGICHTVFGAGQSVTECYTDPNGVDYRGTVHLTDHHLDLKPGEMVLTTRNKECQKWTSQWPHTHSRTPSSYPGKGLGDHNYCRNPDNTPGGAWCYTTDKSLRWDFCDIGQASKSCEVEDIVPNGFEYGCAGCKDDPSCKRMNVELCDDPSNKLVQENCQLTCGECSCNQDKRSSVLELLEGLLGKETHR